MRSSFLFGCGVVLLAGLVTTACGSKGTDRNVASITGSQAPGVASGAPDQEKFTRCMEENGGTVGRVEVPKDGPAKGQVSGGPQQGIDTTKQQQALEKCRQYLPDGGAPARLSPDQLEQARKLAKCMRDEGIDYPDPDPATVGAQGALSIPPGVDIKNPEVRAKFDKCVRTAMGTGPGASAAPR